MRSPFLYFPHERLSPAELTAACLDGHLVGLGEGFIVADTVETPQMRAASVAVLATELVATCLDTAAWVWGARADPPQRHDFTRLSGTTTALGRRSALHNLRTSVDDIVTLVSVNVTTPERTVYDLVRSDHPAAIDMCRNLIRDYHLDVRNIARRCTAAGAFPGRLRSFALVDELLTITAS